MICFTVAGPYSSDSIQHMFSPLLSINAPIARSWAITICSSLGRKIISSIPGEPFAASLRVDRTVILAGSTTFVLIFWFCIRTVSRCIGSAIRALAKQSEVMFLLVLQVMHY